MRLLNTRTLKLETFYDGDIPIYAILSHTWDREEVLFQDIENGTANLRYGYAKMIGACEQARKDGFEYIWIDTCCIDKSSSAELSEAINSMFRWYRQAQVCYAFLSDVQQGQDHRAPGSSFRRARWFTRGWTLQELIAPSVVYFFASDWREIGSRHDLLDPIVDITRISASYFDTGNLSKFSAAQKMSWASNRFTTRVEDMAYSLLGIFDINMPLLYGEGHRAFQRLQEEILKDTEDDSILYHSVHSIFQGGNPILAETPKAFILSGGVTVHSWPYEVERESGFLSRNISISRRRIEMSFFVGQDSRDDAGGRTLSVLLNCSVNNHANGRPSLVLILKEVSPGVFSRRTVTDTPYWKTTASIQLMQDAVPLKIIMTREDFQLNSSRESIYGPKAWHGMKLDMWLLYAARPISDGQPHRVAVLREAGSRQRRPLYLDPRPWKSMTNAVIVKGPGQTAPIFEIVDVDLLSGGFHASWIQVGDEVHLYPTKSTTFNRPTLFYSNMQGKSFMIVLTPEVASIDTRLYTNIPPCKGKNLAELASEVESTHPVGTCVEGCPARKCIPCSRQMVDDNTSVIIELSTRKRANGWWVFISARPS
ncbi:heterokaryon incompatibility protein-domain-containing protein [Apiosordaria backusii]|uniref:Heterokaryon incompatibility protein-domain-containing protein n=1 Tax=Apiosordaria backusii TaxID=314023 RepID=A0AA40ASQ8_9PEZI|nr:heterokaryon incompatibility protein-domain-containing protein [Apiosordaria backusii]